MRKVGDKIKKFILHRDYTLNIQYTTYSQRLHKNLDAVIVEQDHQSGLGCNLAE